MALIIDGYNLLHAANIVAIGPGAYSLAKSRRSLLRFLASIVAKDERPTTTVVFDGAQAPPGLPRESEFAGMRVVFSRSGEEADDVIEGLIQQDTSPRQLTVVSSDHRLHRAARRRQAKAVDSEQWCQQRRVQRSVADPKSVPQQKSDDPTIDDQDVAEWMEIFGNVDLDLGNRPPDRRLDRRQPASDLESAEVEEAPPEEQDDRQASVDDDFNPFPDGYGEDLLADE